MYSMILSYRVSLAVLGRWFLMANSPYHNEDAGSDATPKVPPQRR